MKKTVFLLPKEVNPTTGGQQYDIHFMETIKQFESNTEVVTDTKLAWNPGISILYNIIYLFQLKTFLSANIIITNSRLYPRLFFFVLFLKCLGKKTKLICIHHHYNFLTQVGIKRVIIKFLEIKFLKLFHCVIIPSKYVKSLSEQFLEKSKIHLLEIGFDKNTNSLQNKTTHNKLLYVGTIEKRKGIHLLLEALNQVKGEYELNIIGKYVPNDQYYLSLIDMLKRFKLEKKVFFRGRVSDQDLHSYYSNSSLFVFPSLHEGYGMVLIEAMSYGLPVIAFNNSSMPYIIQNNQNGYLIEDKNTSEFGIRINELLRSPEKLELFNRNALSTFKNARSNEDLDLDIKSFYNKLNK
ncbi:Glycosyltransferase involved in cell wall bisynthesis [Arenibacter palladensis]|uniref:Glycosyltransferase involved in cell wall bisynthesis n=2 Tax=Arenibacter palladensis TaxID=237373 RepID=A0A1M4U1D5_9FLAO|nr:Glycosyltransferase involved in cell wall bisynthesis [Arenibacter palladensis]